MKKLLPLIVIAAGCAYLPLPAAAQYMVMPYGPPIGMGPGYAVGGYYAPMAGYGAYYGYGPYYGGYSPYYGYGSYYGYGGFGRCVTDEGYGRIAVCNGAVR